MKNYDKAYQEYKSISGLSDKDMNTWIKINPFVNEWIINRTKLRDINGNTIRKVTLTSGSYG